MRTPTTRSHAVVVGASIAGLLAARVLTADGGAGTAPDPRRGGLTRDDSLPYNRPPPRRGRVGVGGAWGRGPLDWGMVSGSATAQQGSNKGRGVEALVRTGGVGVVLRLTALVTTVLGVVAAMAVPLPAIRQPVRAAVPARNGPGRPGQGAERLGAARRLHPPRPFIAVQLASPALDHVPLDAVLTLRFSMPVNTLVTQQSFRIVPAVPGGITWSDPTTMVFRPEAPLAYRTAYDVSVSAPPAGMSSSEGDGEFTLHTVSPPVALARPFTLTFDDCGPPERIRAILDALADRELHAIFFPTGQCRDQLPWLVPALVAAGHQVCNHTYSHPVLPRLSSAAIATEIRRGVSVNCNLFRPPYGALDSGGRVAGVAASLGYRLQLWDVDTRDWAGTPADMMDQMIRARGGVVLFHMHGIHTVEAIQNL